MRFRPVRILSSFVAVSALCASAVVSPAGATTVTQTYGVTGSITVGPPPALVLPEGSSVTFDLDQTTGAITNGVSTIPPFERGGTGPQATFVLTDTQPFTGTIDPVTGAATIEFSYDVLVQISADIICELDGPVAFTMTTDGPGGSPLADGTATVVASGFTIPEVIVGDTCPAEVAELANGLFGTPTTDTAATFTVTFTAPTPEPTPEPQPEPAPEPAPVPAVPTFTG
jgi:hypothetical protein